MKPSMLEAVETARGAPPAPAQRRTRSPALAVAGELARAGADALLLAPRTALFLARAPTLRAAVRADLAERRAVEDAPPPRALPARPLRLFLASAEPSGERHAVHLAQALRAELARAGAPPPEILALGGERTRALGIETVGDPLERAAMGADPLRSLPFYASLLARTAARLEAFRPDACVPVDSPALHVPLLRIARGQGLRTAHFVAPQYWGWAPWRVDGYRRVVEHALAILPFEPAWFARHGVRASFVGHPELEAGLAAPLPDEQRAGLVLLPGSRSGVIARNLPWMLAAAAELRTRLPGLEVVLPHDRADRRAELEAGLRAAGATGWVRLALGDLHGELAGARAALSVSGTILIDLLQHRLPAAVIYRLGSRLAAWAAPHALTVPWFSSVNLLAGRPVYFEACFRGQGPRAEVVAYLERALTQPAWCAETRAALDDVAARLGPPGAVERAARHVLALASGGAGR